MSLPDLDWSRLIDMVADIPTDIIFQIVENGQFHEINAHKMVIGIISPTFKLMFYTTEVGDKNAQEIRVEETTRLAFQIIIDHLYKVRSLEDSLKDKPLQDVFDVVNLLERYQMTDLQKVVNELLANYLMTDDTVLEVAAEAMNQSRLFQKEAEILLLICAKFLKPKLKDAKSIFKFSQENEDQKEVVATLLALMNKCSNCGYNRCQDGNEIKEGEFRKGLLLTNTPADIERYWGNDRGIASVTDVNATMVAVYGEGFQVEFGYKKVSSTGKPMFRFACN